MKKLMAANWKMFKTRAEAKQTAQELVNLVGQLSDDREVAVFPTFTSLSEVADIFASHTGFTVGGQDFYTAQEGAFTGEIAPKMLRDCGAEYGLTGHSERRHILGETDEFIGQKTAFGLASGLKIVLCVGELIEERKAGDVEQVLTRQIEIGLKDIPRDTDSDRLAIAYEPVWAIGTGEVAGPEEIVEAHAICRKVLISIFGEKGKEIRILYGGSVKPDNCANIISLDNVNGVLVGGASLQGESFSKIVLA